MSETTVPHTPRDEAMDNVHYLPGARSEPPNVVQLRPSFRDLYSLAGSFGDAFDVALGKSPKTPDLSDMIQLSEALDTLALRARKFGYALSKPSLLVIAQDVESLSERVMFIASELGDSK